MFGLIPFKFRFRGQVGKLLDIYYCMLETGSGLHPTQIAKRTGISFAEVARRLDATPELFVKLPRREGITRYRITPSASAPITADSVPVPNPAACSDANSAGERPAPIPEIW